MLKTTPCNQSAIKLLGHVYIRMGSATSHCSVAVAGISATVVDLREKAVQLSGHVGDKQVVFWLPRKALVKMQRYDGSDSVFCSLAHWFEPTGYTAWALGALTSCSSIAA